jgi:hypothetical protein
MKLTDLDPKWLTRDGKRVGFTFLSPVGKQGNTHWRQSCFTVAGFSTMEQWEIFGQPDCQQTQGCNSACGWVVDGGIDNATFETLTVTPSIDGSAGGLWHGFITNGEIR